MGDSEDRKNHTADGDEALVSIIVPVYHAKEYIAQTIRCVEEQTFHGWELILVDDCGGDGSLGRMQELREASPCRDQIRIVRNEKNLGAAESRNHGVREARGRYIAFLDADDVWLPTKLEEQLLFMRQKGIGFSFTSYEFGDEEAVPTGRVVHVPGRLDFRHALSRTVIFTSTVIFDTRIVPKAQIRMPDMASEDTALWWTILKTGVTACGMDRALTVYRRPAQSLSSNKKSSVKRLWNLLIEVAGCSKIAAFFHLIGWAFHATMRRIWFRRITNHVDCWNRAVVLLSGLAEAIIAVLVYAIYWFHIYYPVLESPRISREGFYFGPGLKLFRRGHILVLLIYLLLVFVMLRALRGNKVGEQKPGSQFMNQMFALILTNLITYFQLSLMNNWLVPVMPMLLILLWQALGSLIVSYLTYSIYRGLFSAKEMLLVSGTDDVDSVLSRFSTRSDMYYISRVVNTEQVDETETLRAADAFRNVILWNVEGGLKGRLARYCYAHGINVYLMPDTDDVLVKGTDTLHQFSTSIYLLKNYPMEAEQRIVKRLLDIVLSLVLIGLLSPLLAVIAVMVRVSGRAAGRRGESFAGEDGDAACGKEARTGEDIPGRGERREKEAGNGSHGQGKDGGRVLHRSERVTRGGKHFAMLKFRTVKEVLPDGTLVYLKGGRALRRSHLDELPQLFNILRGDMSFIGPRPDKAEVYEARCTEYPLYACRTRVKAGMIGYTQVYGKYNSSLEERLNLDLEYIQNYSLWLDVQLFIFSIKFFTRADDEKQE